MEWPEYVEQALYDKLEREAEQERAMDSKLLADNARLARRIGVR